MAAAIAPAEDVQTLLHKFAQPGRHPPTIGLFQQAALDPRHASYPIDRNDVNI
ncbi:hypothetical protein [Ferruginivarius sediminum]|uniref:hypothetical protein n=1 Tax=Ferruginivarius sediminum TaxID=2661937 RepID=UPI001293EEAB|nr:hypothetical protein [Ferruginivarius sediminum]